MLWNVISSAIACRVILDTTEEPWKSEIPQLPIYFTLLLCSCRKRSIMCEMNINILITCIYFGQLYRNNLMTLIIMYIAKYTIVNVLWIFQHNNFPIVCSALEVSRGCNAWFIVCKFSELREICYGVHFFPLAFKCVGSMATWIRNKFVRKIW